MKIRINLITFLLFICLISGFNTSLSLKNRCVKRIKSKFLFTEIKPDKDSTSLRLSTEKLGKYSW
jgi:hypothetical protein